MLTVRFGESLMNRKQVQLWNNRFKEGQENAYSGLTSTSTSSDAVRIMILRNVEPLCERMVMMMAYRLTHTKKYLRMF